MYTRIHTAIDNSPFSAACCDAAVSLALAFGGTVVGSHVYAAGLHERRFRQMETALPEQYLVDGVLSRQRAIHNKLITLGLRLIANCYLDVLERRCRETGIPFRRKTDDGKNWERLTADIATGDYDLVVLGVRGHGTPRPDAIGSVCLRVLRHSRTDSLVIKDLATFDDGAGRAIMVALDGSAESFGALEAAFGLAKAYAKPIEVVAAYDPYFHYAVFQSMVRVLSGKAARVFRFQEQERLHEEIIDSGLARLYQTHLEVARRLAEAAGVPVATTLLTGRAADAVLEHAERTKPWLLCLGRIGAHSRDDTDIGSATEHLLRLAPCNLLVASRRLTPPLEIWGQSTLRWTSEAQALLDRAPAEHRGGLRLLVQRLAMEQGHAVVTAGLLGAALAAVRPGEDELRRMAEAAYAVAAEALREEAGMAYLCPQCGHAARQRRPLQCPECRAEGAGFLTLDTAEIEALAEPVP